MVQWIATGSNRNILIWMTPSVFNLPEYIWNTARCTLSNNIFSKRELWAHKTSLTPSLITEVKKDYDQHVVST
jgi:hypothetical protein